MSELPVFLLVAKRDTFYALLCLYNAVQRGEYTQIRSLLAYELFIN